MKVSLKWLRDYVDITLPPEELAHRLTLGGAEAEAVPTAAETWRDVRIARVTSVVPHPNADRLKLATVDLDGESMTVVCGAPNVAAGQKVAFAREGARIIDGRTGQPATLKAATIRGVESRGMVLSERELGISDSHEGILVLPEDAPVGMALADYLGDTVLDMDITPNRPDLLSVLGVAREVAAITGTSVREPTVTYSEDGPPVASKVAVEIADPDLCYRYCAAYIEGVQIGPSPAWMQERLTSAGLRPINNVVDVTNYVMLEYGQPLHAFDFTLLKGGRIIVRRARSGEKLTTIDGEDHELSPDMLVIADAEEAVAVAGIMGGALSEVAPTTTTVLLESANFNNISIRRTSAALKLRTESSSRFEKGLHPELAMVAARRASQLIVQLAGGRVAKGILDVYPDRREPVIINLTRKRIAQVLGTDVPPQRVVAILTSLGFAAQPTDDAYKVTVPYWRTDVTIPDDLVEELARTIGYDNLPTTVLRGRVPPIQPDPRRELRERVKASLVNAGMQEIITYSLTNLETLGKVLPASELEQQPPLRLANPMSREWQHLRTSLRASILETLARNRRQRPDHLISLFEIAPIFIPPPNNAVVLPEERETLIGVIAGREPDRWGRPEGEPVDFYHAKGIVEYLLTELGVPTQYRPVERFAYLPGRTAEIAVTGSGAVIGVVGQVHPQVAASFDLDEEVYWFEIDLAALLPHLPGVRVYEPLPRYPAVREDLAVIVDANIEAARVQTLIETAPLVRRVAVFDVYSGPPVPPGKKSLAFSITYQAPDRTLTESEVTRVRDRIIQRLERELGATLRG